MPNEDIPPPLNRPCVPPQCKMILTDHLLYLLGGPESLSKRGCYITPQPRPATTEHLFDRREFIDWFDGWDKFLETIVNE